MAVDEITGLLVNHPTGSSEPLFIIIDRRRRTALACASSYGRACEIQLLRGWAAFSYIKEF